MTIAALIFQDGNEKTVEVNVLNSSEGISITTKVKNMNTWEYVKQIKSLKKDIAESGGNHFSNMKHVG